MIRLSNVVWMLVIVVAAFMLYKVKYEVQSLRAQIADTEKKVEEEKEAMHVVAAEWAYLNRPERLQQLASKYLASAGVTADKIADIQAIPFPQQMDAANDDNDNEDAASLKLASLKHDTGR